MNDLKKTTHRTQQLPTAKDNSLLFLTLAVAGFFVGLFLTISLFSVTLISFYTLSKLLVGFAFVGFLIPLKYYRKWFQFIKYEMILFNVIGVAPMLTGLFLTLNYLLTSNHTTTAHEIEKLYFDEGKFIGIVLANNTFGEEQKIVGFMEQHPSEIANKQFLKLTLAEGLFGFQVIKERELVK